MIYLWSLDHAMSKVKSTGIVDMTFTMHEMRVGKVSVRPHTVTGTLKRREEGERRPDILHPSRCARPTEDPVERLATGLGKVARLLERVSWKQ